MQNVTQFSAASRYVVTGTNPQMADYDNKRGEIYGLAYYVQASNAHGDTWELHLFIAAVGMDADSAPKAERVAAALQARLDNLGKLPVNAAQWQQGRAVYGSDAYVEYGQDDDVALERREAEDEALGF